MSTCTIEFPRSINDRVKVYGESGWTVTGLCYSVNSGLSFIVDKGMESKVVPMSATEEDTPLSFREVMVEAQRMCYTVNDCDACPLRVENCGCEFSITQLSDWSGEFIGRFERVVTQWAAKHPEEDEDETTD